MKKILVLVCLFSSMALYAETLKTDNPNRYFKNFVCHSDGKFTANIVNKTNKGWMETYITVIDSDGDPIDTLRWDIPVNSNSGIKVIYEEGGFVSVSHRRITFSCSRLFNNKTKSLYRHEITTKDW